jgi:AraC-like DNA-binding protein/quercetin dioxygenase-like cupin family protein
MKALIQKLPLNQNNSFVAQTFRTPDFEVGWHQHIEYELILFTKGSGLSFVGNHVGEFEKGDVYLLGSNLPHTFQKREATQITSAVVVHFRSDFWGHELLNIPECRDIKKLLDTSLFGLKIQGKTKKRLGPMVKALETTTDFKRILLLGECLEVIASSEEYVQLSTQGPKQPSNKESIDRIIQFTIDNFRDPVSISQVAEIACMSVPAFCNYFKKSTKKTYIDFLTEVRIGYACTLLMETDKTVLDICFECGYNTMSNFHKKFMKIKTYTPLQYRKHFAERQSLPQKNIHIFED